MTHKVAIIGAGIGAEHLRAYLTLRDRFEVLCLCDLDEARAKQVASPYGIACDTDFANILSDPNLDIVDVCLPPHLHLDASLAALEAGKHVICEKPLVTSLAAAERLAVKSAETGRQVFPVFQYRYGLGSAQLLKLIELGIAGKCYAGSLETHWNRDEAYYAVDWRGTWAGEQGGALLGHAIHIHDLVSAFLGPIAGLHAETATRVNDIETEDCAALTLRMKSGALVTSSVTLGAATDSSRLRLMFEGFTVESDHAPYAPAAKAWTFQARSPIRQTQIDDAFATVTAPPAGFPGFLTEVANAIDGKPSQAVTLPDGRRSVELVTAAYHSARTGLPVDLPIEADHPLFKGWVAR